MSNSTYFCNPHTWIGKTKHTFVIATGEYDIEQKQNIINYKNIN
jgi:hypothetical protein